MGANSGNKTRQEVWLELGELLGDKLPQLASVLGDEGEFISLLVKPMPDGTMLAILKRYGSDGTPMVCFGSGYSVAGCFIGVEGTIAAGKWRPDVPWGERAK